MFVKLRNFIANSKTNPFYLNIHDARSGSWLVVSQVFAMLVGFLLTVMLAKILSKPDFGIYKYILTFIPVASVFALEGLDIVFFRKLAQGLPASLSAYMKTKLIFILTAGLVSGLGFSFWAGLRSEFESGFWFWVLFWNLVLFAQALAFYNAYFIAKREFTKMAHSDMFVKGFQLVVVLVLAVLYKDPFILSIGFVLAQILARLLVWIVLFMRSEPIFQYISGQIVQTDLKLALYLSFTNLMVAFFGNIDKWFAMHFFDVSFFSEYVVASILPMAAVSVLVALTNLFYTKLAQNKLQTTEEFKNMITSMGKIFIILFVVSLGYLLIVGFVFNLIFPKYPDALKMSYLFAILIPFYVLNHMSRQMLIVQNDNMHLIKNTAFAISVFIVTFFVFTPFLGVWALFVSLGLYLFASIVADMFVIYHELKTGAKKSYQ